MLSNEQIYANKERFIELISSIEREGSDIEALIKKLENSDFFYAPASTMYHGAYPGGLCEHSLNVYYNLVNLCEQKDGLDDECHDQESLKIVALLHDISKMNIYERSVKNEKIYCDPSETTSKCHDELGYYRWQSSMGYRTKKKKFCYGSHEMTSEYIIRNFIPLTLAESISVLHHMGGMHHDSAQDNLSEVYTQYSLALMLHLADMLATYVDERCYE